MPYIAAFLISLGLITYIPQISMGLPTLLSGEETKAGAANKGGGTGTGSADSGDYGADIPALDPSEIDGEYHWTAAMTVADTSINYMMVDKFAELVKQADELVSATYPVVPLYYKSNNYLLKDYVQGVYMTSSSNLYFKNASVLAK